MTVVEQVANPVCPRCGYELGAHVAAWGSECPMSGTCPECGLEFAWRDVLDPRRLFPKWFVETPSGRTSAQLAGTVWRVLRPWSFWRRISMAQPFRAHRALLALAFGLAALHLPAVALHLGNEGLAYLQFKWIGAMHRPDFLRCAVAFGEVGWIGRGWMVLPINLLFALMMLLVPLTFGLMPLSLRRAKVLRSHVVRAFIYSLTPLLLLWQVETIIPALASGAVHFGRMVLGVSPGVSSSVYLTAADVAPIVAHAALALWPVIYWRAVCRNYLRLPRATLIAVLLTLLSFLLAVLICMMIPVMRHELAWRYC